MRESDLHRNDIRVILFDVGGVLVELSGFSTLLSWLAGRATVDQVYTIWLSSPNVRAFETGKMDPDVFAERLIAELGLPIATERFLAEFSKWGLTLLPGAVELLAQVPQHYVRATLCNTNVLHWPNVMQHPELLEHFEHHFASHLTGRIKPDEEAFLHVIDSLSCKASEILFVDDSRLNVEAAKRVGMSAFQVKGPREAEEALRQAGVVST